MNIKVKVNPTVALEKIMRMRKAVGLLSAAAPNTDTVEIAREAINECFRDIAETVELEKE